MTTFRALVVEDEESRARTTKLLLERFSLDDFDEWRGVSPEVDIAATQEEVDQLVAAAVSSGRPYDLVLLDLKYPKSAMAKFSSEDKVYEGMEWLPEARRRLPEAAIVVYTSYPHEIAVEDVVKSILEHNANEFIPKTEPWSAVAQRLRIALRHSVDHRKTRKAERYWQEFEAAVMRTLAEDIIAIIDDGRAPLESIARGIESGDPSAIEASPDRIRTTYQDIRRLARAKANVSRGESVPRQIDNLGVWLRTFCSVYEDWFWRIGAKMVVEGGDNIQIGVRQTELRVTLLAIILNAEYALRTSRRPEGMRELRIRVAGGGDTPVSIMIEDNGDGFPPDALPERVFSPEYSSRGDEQDAKEIRRNRYRGMGLHVAQQMMSSIGWKIEAGPAAVPPGARVTLTMP